MIETIFQPIIPGMDIDGWKITDYLTGDQETLICDDRMDA